MNVASFLPRVAHASQHAQLHRGVDQPREDEQQYDGWSDEEKLTIEAHSRN